jgi:uncharacterized membrane protein YphA (DoxX/SURF4 family)
MMRLTTLNVSNPVGQAFWSMLIIFTIAPILFGLDKFFNFLVDWPRYLAPWIPSMFGVTPQTFMYAVGAIEIVVGILVGIWPAVFAYVVMLWLWGIIVNLLSIPGYYDIALRDLGLSIGALGLARLAYAHHMERRGELGVVHEEPYVPAEERRAA